MANPAEHEKCLVWHPHFNVPDMLPDAINRVLEFDDLFVNDADGNGQLMLWGGMQMQMSVDMSWPGEGMGLDEGGIGLGDVGLGV